jgi:hypothetical protein
MASGPDPNQFIPPDPEATAEVHRRGEGLGDLPSTRLWLPVWAIVLLALAIGAGVVYLALGGRPAP